MIRLDLGIYINVFEDGVASDKKHKMYSATCSVCGTTVRQRMSDLKRSADRCHHSRSTATSKINDMPRGWTSKSELNKKIYYLWKAMIARTTPAYWAEFPTYEGTTVDERWLRLSNFVEDIQAIDGYHEWTVCPKNAMMLDKDTRIKGNKHYSKDTCCFISHADSNRDVFNRHSDNLNIARTVMLQNQSEPVRFTNVKTQEAKEFNSLKEGCRELNLNLRNAWKILSDKYPDCKTTQGWTIEKI